MNTGNPKKIAQCLRRVSDTAHIPMVLTLALAYASRLPIDGEDKDQHFQDNVKEVGVDCLYQVNEYQVLDVEFAYSQFKDIWYTRAEAACMPFAEGLKQMEGLEPQDLEVFKSVNAILKVEYGRQ